MLDIHKKHASLYNWPVYQVFGLSLVSDYPFGARLLPGEGPADLVFTCKTASPGNIDWDGRLPAYASANRNAQGQSHFSYYRLDGYDVMRYAGLADYYLWSDGILCHLLNPDQSELAAVHIAPAVFLMWLELQRGIPALHASGVSIDGRLVAFLGHKGSGKSTLAVSFAQTGYPILSDDALPVEGRGGDFWCQPAYPQARLWPEQIDRYLEDEFQLEDIQSGYAKRRALLETGDRDWFCDRPLPLACVYLLQRGDPNEAEQKIEISSLTARDALLELMRYAIAPRIGWALGFTASRFDLFSRLAQEVPVRRLIYPSGLSFMGAVRAAIMSDLK